MITVGRTKNEGGGLGVLWGEEDGLVFAREGARRGGGGKREGGTWGVEGREEKGGEGGERWSGGGGSRGGRGVQGGFIGDY